MMRPPQITRRAIAEKVRYRKWHDPPSIVWISVIVCQSKMQTPSTNILGMYKFFSFLHHSGVDQEVWNA